MENIAIIFGKRIRSIRQSKQISQEKLAELCGLHPVFIGQIERGEKSPSLDSINKLAHGLGVQLSDLFVHIDNKIEFESMDYASQIYDEIICLSDDKKETLYNIICDIKSF